jgi:hypothetical protein
MLVCGRGDKYGSPRKDGPGWAIEGAGRLKNLEKLKKSEKSFFNGLTL